MVQSRGKAVFRLSGFSCGPDEITKALGVPPTNSWSSGDVVPGTTLKRQSSGWELATRLLKDRDLSDQVNDVLSQLHPIKQNIKRLQHGGTCLISCVLYIDPEERPALYISDASISDMAEIKAGFDIDIYHLS